MNNAQTARKVWGDAERALASAQERAKLAERDYFVEMQRDSGADPWPHPCASACRCAHEQVEDAKSVVWAAREDYLDLCAKEAQMDLFDAA